MQLLHWCPIPAAEFASLSLLLKNEDSAGESSWSMGEALSIASPLATLSSSDATLTLMELHEYLNCVYRSLDTVNIESSPSNKKRGCEVPSADQLWLDDRHLLDDESVQVFRPSEGHGVGVHFSVIRDSSTVDRCASIVLRAGTAGKGVRTKESGSVVVGIVLCLGISGLAYAHSSSTLMHTMLQRMHDGISILKSISLYNDGVECEVSIKAILATMTLTDDEERKTNAMIEAEAVTMMSEVETDTPNDKLKATMSPIGAVLKTKRVPSKRGSLLKRDSFGASELRLTMEALSSADMARVTAERLAVLSVAEKDANLRRYEVKGQQKARNSVELGLGKSRVRARRRKSGNDADLDDFDCPGSPNATANVPVQAQLKAPGTDTVPRISKKAAVPTLMAPRNDLASRRASQQSTKQWVLGAANMKRSGPESSRLPNSFRLTPPVSDGGSQRHAAFNAFAVASQSKDPEMSASFSNIDFAGVSESHGGTDSGHTLGLELDSWGLSSPSTAESQVPTSRATGVRGKVARGGAYPFASDYTRESQRTATTFNSTWSSSSGHGTLPSESSRQKALLDEDDEDSSDRQAAAIQHLPFFATRPDGQDVDGLGERDDLGFAAREWSAPTEAELLPFQNVRNDLPGGDYEKASEIKPGGDYIVDSIPPRLMINLALNEDLTCLYKQSKIAACTIEGVVQVQVKSDSRNGVPFFLLVRDPSRHIKVIQENRRYADDMTRVLAGRNDETLAVDYKFTVSVPNAENYFPIMRYRCSTDLRPVPIRVQTRVRLHGAYCRVALQISSNPANEDDLTDLTIVMGVPLEVKGETLTTSPAGGVWNAAKRSVVWCVAELGDGEKFQLQAQFELDPSKMAESEGQKPKFPVLVRCQCMYAQLSDIELEVCDIPEIFPADVTMKLARRFRLSHRERS